MVSANIPGKLKVDFVSSANDSNTTKKTSDSDFTKILDSHTSNDNKGNVKTNNKNSDVKNVIKKFYTEKPDINKENMKIDEKDVKEAVVEVYSQIVNVIADTLGTNPEEIKNIMDKLEINSEDLMDSQSVVKIVSEYLEITNPVDVLTNNEAINAVKEINQSINDLLDEFKEEFAVSDNELKDLLSQVDDTQISEVVVSKDTINEVKNEINSDKSNVDINSDMHNDVVEEKVSIKNESGSNAADSKGFHSDKESKAEIYPEGNAIDNIVSNLKDAITDNFTIDGEIADKIVKQITDDIKLYAKSDMTSLEIQLEPETLGKVGITVTSKAGTLTAQLVVQNEVAKEAIESQITTLKESFINQDIKVDAIEVVIASKEFEQNLDKGAADSSEHNEQKRRKHISAEELAEINGSANENETVMDNVLKEMGTTVSYSA